MPVVEFVHEHSTGRSGLQTIELSRVPIVGEVVYLPPFGDDEDEMNFLVGLVIHQQGRTEAAQAYGRPIDDDEIRELAAAARS